MRPDKIEAVKSGVAAAFGAMQAGLMEASKPTLLKEHHMTPPLTWFDRLLLKIAIAKALARHCEDLPDWVRQARNAFGEINRRQG